jgi:hypothetical protein
MCSGILGQVGVSEPHEERHGDFALGAPRRVFPPAPGAHGERQRRRQVRLRPQVRFSGVASFECSILEQSNGGAVLGKRNANVCADPRCQSTTAESGSFDRAGHRQDRIGPGCFVDIGARRLPHAEGSKGHADAEGPFGRNAVARGEGEQEAVRVELGERSAEKRSVGHDEPYGRIQLKDLYLVTVAAWRLCCGVPGAQAAERNDDALEQPTH